MQRYLQLTISEPLKPPDERVQIKLAVIGIDLAKSGVTLPGGFVCSLESLTHAVDTMKAAQRRWLQSGGYDPKSRW